MEMQDTFLFETNKLLVFYLRVILCKITLNRDMPFYFENNGSNFGGVHEDANIREVIESGYTGKGITMRFLSNGYNLEHDDFINRLDESKSHNFLTNSTDLSFSNPELIKQGTSMLSVAIGKSLGDKIVGIAPNVKFNMIIPSPKVDSLDEILNQISYNDRCSDDIIIDTWTSTKIDWKNGSSSIYQYRLNLQAYDYLTSVTYCGRSYRGSIVIVPIRFSTNNCPTYQSLFEQYSEAILVAPSDYRGLSGPYNFYSYAILVNTPSYGNSAGNANNAYPPIKVVSPKKSHSYIDSDDQGLEAGVLAGVVALILEANAGLSFIDIQWILIHSASINDPTHPKWIKNGAGYYYNPIYGFGRVDSALSIKLAKNWSNKIIPKRQAIRAISMETVRLPYARQGTVSFSFHIETDLFVENVYIRFNTSNPDISMLRIILESPMGTKIEILRPSSIIDESPFPDQFYRTDAYRLLARAFFGEASLGDWKVTFIDSSFITDNNLTNVALHIEGIRGKPKGMPSFPRREQNSTTVLLPEALNLSIKLNVSEVVCGDYVRIDVSSLPTGLKDPRSFFIITPDKRSLPLDASIINHKSVNSTSKQDNNMISFEFQVPCILKGEKDIQIAYEIRHLGVAAYAPLHIRNVYTNLTILNPPPYSEIISNFGKVAQIEMLFAEGRKSFPATSLDRFYATALYNLESNRRVSASTDPAPRSHLMAWSEASKVTKGVVVAVAIDQESPHECNTLVLPVSFTSHKHPEKIMFGIPLNTMCEVPPGVLVTDPPEHHPTVDFTVNVEIIGSVAGAGAIIISAMIIGLFMFKREYDKNNRTLLDDQIIL